MIKYHIPSKVYCLRASDFCHHFSVFFIADGMAFSTAYFGAGSGFISMDNLGCYGSPIPLQGSLTDCPYIMAVGDSHSEDAGIRCFDSMSQ